MEPPAADNRRHDDDGRLPVEDVVPALKSALSDSGTALLVAPPGSGKSTIVPLRLLDEPWLDGGRIMVLEPRRLATRAAARRMSDLREERVGETVGYVTRDERRIGPGTRIEVVTEGILTRRLQNDPELSGVGLVIFDEFHERNLQTDLGLALTLDVIGSLRPDLRLLLMSATIDAEAIAEALESQLAIRPPVIASESRQYPIDVRYAGSGRTAGGSRSNPNSRKRSGAGRNFNDPVPAVCRLVHRALDEEVGDVLVFLPGMGEIVRTERQLTDDGVLAEIHRLHGSLSLDDQATALAPSMRRKVVLSTDIAETSLTVEGVTVVVDSGLTRTPRFDTRTGMTRLQTVSISQASADQRAGRAGRTEEGVAYRAWSKIEHAARRPQTPPEITEVDLAGLVLELRTWGVRTPESLFFLDPPPAKIWTEAEELLTTLGALTDNGDLTELGRRMTAVPSHPRLARMILEADNESEQRLACLLTAIVDERDLLAGMRRSAPVDLAVRAHLVIQQHSGGRGHSHSVDEVVARQANRRSVERVGRTAADLMRRVGIGGSVDDIAASLVEASSGRVLALAFPDRLAIARGSQGRYQLRTRTTAWMSSSDPLATSRFLIAADLDGKRKDARIRLAAALDEVDVFDRFSAAIETQVSLRLDSGRVMERRQSRIGGVVLAEATKRAEPGQESAHLLGEAIKRKPDLLDWGSAKTGTSLRRRVQLLHQRLGAPWPDWSDKALMADLDSWLAPTLAAVTSIDELNRFDPNRLLERSLDHRLRRDLDRLAPTDIVLPSGRTVTVDYDRDEPTVSSMAQDFYGLTATPEVAGQPVVVELLSPARRPIQVTTDLGGFWAGSWVEVRKDMAGRYPKHSWPKNPSAGQ